MVRTAAHNKKISDGMKRWHKKTMDAFRLSSGSYMKSLGRAAQYRNLKKQGKATPTQKRMAERRRTGAKRPRRILDDLDRELAEEKKAKRLAAKKKK